MNAIEKLMARLGLKSPAELEALYEQAGSDPAVRDRITKALQDTHEESSERLEKILRPNLLK